MNLANRTARFDDFEQVYRCIYTTFGFDDSPRDNVLREWQTFRANDCSLNVVVEDLHRPDDSRIVAYTEGVFLKPQFMQSMLSGTAPYVNLQIALSAKSGELPLLDVSAIRKANSAGGLCFLIAYSGWSEPPLDADEAYHVRTYLERSFSSIGAGYNFREVMIEVVGEAPLNRALNAGFLLRSDYTAFYSTHEPPPPHLRPYLLSITREEAKENDGSLMARVFAYTPPRFHFKPRDQELLRLALQEMTEEEVAARLGCTVGNVKKHWEALYCQVENTAPGLLPEASFSRRGPEKRRLLLGYLRSHPEELRPYMPKACT